MDLEEIKRGLRAEIKKRENEQYFTFQCNASDDGSWVLKSEADAEIRRLRRALYIARAKRAIEKITWFKLWNARKSTMNPEDCTWQEFDKWMKALGKFLKKAEEYK